MSDDEYEVSEGGSGSEEEGMKVAAEEQEVAKVKSKKNKKKRKLVMEAAEADLRGVCYLSRVPPQMDHVKLRHKLSEYGEIERIYLVPEDPAAQVHRKKAGGFRGVRFSEGWVEFTNKFVAKRVADMLNCQPIGGKKRSAYYHDLWNIKYLSKFKWDDLTDEIAYKNAARQQKLALEVSAATRERDSYLKKVDKARELSAKAERLNKKKQKIQQESATEAEIPVNQPAEFKVFRQFPQNKPVAKAAAPRGPKLSRSILSSVFGSGS
uniref:Pre-rRNA-processing protein ESF2 n=1 Tax=Kalanchoe fedtschenkoi TaxID=63787 RepID=A0A7N0TP32_KALFE